MNLFFYFRIWRSIKYSKVVRSMSCIFRFLFILPLKPCSKISLFQNVLYIPSIDLLYRQIFLLAPFLCLSQVKKNYWKERQKGKAINNTWLCPGLGLSVELVQHMASDKSNTFEQGLTDNITSRYACEWP